MLHAEPFLIWHRLLRRDGALVQLGLDLVLQTHLLLGPSLVSVLVVARVALVHSLLLQKACDRVLADCCSAMLCSPR